MREQKKTLEIYFLLRSHLLRLHVCTYTHTHGLTRVRAYEHVDINFFVLDDSRKEKKIEETRRKKEETTLATFHLRVYLLSSSQVK